MLFQVWSWTFLQRFSSSHSQGFKDEDFGNSPGWWAATFATYFPSRPLQLAQKKMTKHGISTYENRCISLIKGQEVIRDSNLYTSEWTNHESDSNHESLFDNFWEKLMIRITFETLFLSKMRIMTLESSDESSVFSKVIMIRITKSGDSSML